MTRRTRGREWRRHTRRSRPSARCRTSGSTARPSNRSATASTTGSPTSVATMPGRRGSMSAGGEEVCRVIRSDGDETWRIVWNGGIFMLHGSEETGPPRRRETDVPAMALRLHDAVHAELDAGADRRPPHRPGARSRDPRLAGRWRGGLGRGVALFRAAGREFGSVAAAHRRRVSGMAGDPGGRRPRREDRPAARAASMPLSMRSRPPSTRRRRRSR